MLRLAGLLGIVIALGLLGIMKSQQLGARVKLLEDFLQMVLELKGQISYCLLYTSNVACLGCCSLAPVMMVKSADGDETYGSLTKEKVTKILDEIRERA